MIRYRTEQKTPVILRESSAAADAQDVVVIELGCSDRASNLQPVRPLTLDRSDGKKQRPGKTTFAPDRRLRDGFFSGDIGKPLRKIGRGKRLYLHEIDRSSHRRFQAIGGKTRDGPNAGFARGEFCPVVGLAGAERVH